MSYKQLTLEERFAIYQFKVAGFTLRDIARRLKRHHTTISRELQRNTSAEGLGPMWIATAQRLCDERRQRARHQRRRDNQPLVQYVLERLCMHWSPEIICGRLELDFVHEPCMRMSHEGIYRWIYADAKAGGDFYRRLCYRHKRRRKQRRYGSGRRLIAGRVPISARPKAVDSRARFGDWEADTVYGHKTRDCVLTHVERKSRYLMARKVTDRSANTVSQSQLQQLSALPPQWRRTVTVDNVGEFADFRRVEDRCGVRIYFADPYCAWQRGTNENTNGLLRRYFPKGSDFSQVSDELLAAVTQSINNRPRKCLNYRTSTEVIQQTFSGALRS